MSRALNEETVRVDIASRAIHSGRSAANQDGDGGVGRGRGALATVVVLGVLGLGVVAYSYQSEANPSPDQNVEAYGARNVQATAPGGYAHAVDPEILRSALAGHPGNGRLGLMWVVGEGSESQIVLQSTGDEQERSEIEQIANSATAAGTVQVVPGVHTRDALEDYRDVAADALRDSVGASVGIGLNSGERTIASQPAIIVTVESGSLDQAVAESLRQAVPDDLLVIQTT